MRGRYAANRRVTEGCQLSRFCGMALLGDQNLLIRVLVRCFRCILIRRMAHLLRHDVLIMRHASHNISALSRCLNSLVETCVAQYASTWRKLHRSHQLTRAVHRSCALLFSMPPCVHKQVQRLTCQVMALTLTEYNTMARSTHKGITIDDGQNLSKHHFTDCCIQLQSEHRRTEVQGHHVRSDRLTLSSRPVPLTASRFMCLLQNCILAAMPLGLRRGCAGSWLQPPS